MGRKINTKEIILEVALSLFSKKGYSGVSIRDISKEVGIKESSVYNHFKNKQEIFQTLCQYFINVTNEMALSYYKRISESATVTEKEFLSFCKSYVNDYLMENKINKFICMLVIEQSVNEEVAKIYHEILFDKALEGQRQLFEWMIKIDFLKEMDLDELVMEYYAPIVYWFHRYLVINTISQDIKDIINQKITNHVERFLAKYKK
ncbi:TetR/AcrR family transcriptional regulator [Lacrimispora sp.]|uniref:TetR/AcrR family transcriptional regulator n=1 Tax=Lacrimispora sp. TaxID=2719234 RepID=UPI0032E41FCD